MSVKVPSTIFLGNQKVIYPILATGEYMLRDVMAEWKPIPMFTTSFNIVTRTANRLLFGAELARDPEFLKLAIEYSDTFFVGANKIRHDPEWLKPFSIYVKTGMYGQMQIARKKLYPLLTTRIAAMREARQNNQEAKFEATKPADVGEFQILNDHVAMLA
jgi:hypothetical protein